MRYFPRAVALLFLFSTTAATLFAQPVSPAPPAPSANPAAEYDDVRNAGTVALQEGDYATALKHFEQAVALADQIPDERDHRKLDARVNLALTYKKLHRFSESAKRYQQAIDLCRETNADPSIYGVVLDNFGNLYDEQHRFAEGEPLHREALAMFEKHLPAESSQVLTCRANLAATLAQQGRFDEAGPLYEKSLAVMENDAKRPDR